MGLEYEHCYHCKPPKRQPGCQTRCPHYLADIAAHRARAEAENAEKQESREYRAYRADQRKHYQKRMGEKVT